MHHRYARTFAVVNQENYNINVHTICKHIPSSSCSRLSFVCSTDEWRVILFSNANFHQLFLHFLVHHIHTHTHRLYDVVSDTSVIVCTLLATLVTNVCLQCCTVCTIPYSRIHQMYMWRQPQTYSLQNMRFATWTQANLCYRLCSQTHIHTLTFILCVVIHD